MKMEKQENKMIGANLPIRDAALKVTGALKYTADMKLPRMLYAKVLFSPIPHGKILEIHTEKAEQLPGVKAVVCYKNSPRRAFNSCGEEIDGAKTEYIFDDRVRFVGDKVAAVAAVDLATAEKAIRLIEVKYEPLPVNYDPLKALDPNAYPIHGETNLIEEVDLSAGDVEKGMEEADQIFEDCYSLPPIHHSAIETHCAIANYESNGKLTVYTACHDIFAHRLNLSRLFQLPMSKVRVITPAIGGGFGGKIDMVCEPIAALLAIKTGRPVKLVYNRREDIPSSRTRHGMELKIRTGVQKSGKIVAQEITAWVNAGAYAGGTMSIVWAMSGKFFKLTKIPNLRFRGIPVYTNMPIAGAMRGFGSPQLFFAQQRQMNKIAKKLKIDMARMELLNLTEPDGVDFRNQQPHGNAHPIDCVKKGMELFGWEEGLKEQETSRKENGRFRIGVGMAVAAHGNGVFGVRPDTTGVMLKMNEDGTVVLFSGVCDMGNGSVTTQCQVVSEILGIPVDGIECIQADTDATMWDLGNYSSRGTYVSVHAAVKVANQMKEEILEEASKMLQRKKEELSLGEWQVVEKMTRNHLASLQEVVSFTKQTDEKDLCCADTFASDSLAVSYGAHFVKVQVDQETGKVKVLSYTAVHDIGKAINPMAVEGQIEGAVQMGLGYALSEGIVLDENGKVKNSSFRTYHIFQADEMPKIQVGFVEPVEPGGPYGAKSIGECSVVPSVSAITNAVSNAVDGDFHQVPVLPEQILAANKEV